MVRYPNVPFLNWLVCILEETFRKVMGKSKLKLKALGWTAHLSFFGALAKLQVFFCLLVCLFWFVSYILFSVFVFCLFVGFFFLFCFFFVLFFGVFFVCLFVCLLFLLLLLFWFSILLPGSMFYLPSTFMVSYITKSSL